MIHVRLLALASLASLASLAVVACGSSRPSGFEDDAGGSSGGASSGGFDPDAGPDAPDAQGPTTTTVTVYANTDDSLYSLDPATKKVALVGKFAGVGGGTNDFNVTDCAVDANGQVWVNTPSVVYKAALPAGGTGTVVLTKVATIAAKAKQQFYALAFAPAGVLGPNETLVGGDGDGQLWSIDTASGNTVQLGSFGPDKTRVFALSGDIVFYTGAGGKPTGLATIRSCAPGGQSCTAGNDFLAGIDMTALSTAYTSGTPAVSLLAGIYGGSGTSTGPGVGFGSLFGLGAWEGTVFAFSRGGGAGKSPSLLSIDTTSGAGSVIDASFSFTNGWSGAGVTTKVTVSVPPPPPPPR